MPKRQIYICLQMRYDINVVYGLLLNAWTRCDLTLRKADRFGLIGSRCFCNRLFNVVPLIFVIRNSRQLSAPSAKEICFFHLGAPRLGLGTGVFLIHNEIRLYIIRRANISWYINCLFLLWKKFRPTLYFRWRNDVSMPHLIWYSALYIFGEYLSGGRFVTRYSYLSLLAV